MKVPIKAKREKKEEKEKGVVGGLSSTLPQCKSVLIEILFLHMNLNL